MSPCRPLPRFVATLAFGLLACAAAGAASPAAHKGPPAAAPGHETPAVPTSPADAKKVPLTMEELRQRLSERITAAQAEPAKGRVPLVNVSVKAKAGAPRPPAPSKVAHAAAGAAPSHGPAHWSYDGPEGPHAWGHLDADFATCERGSRQSPIDIRDGFKLELEPIGFDYRATPFSVIDNGHTVQVNLDEGSALTINRRRYALKQFHFHRPSEERINGRQFEMVVHLVHRDTEGRLAVVAVLVEQGRQHPAVQQVWNNLPLEKHQPNPGLAMLDPTQLLPTDQRYFTYMGSLTTPPCTEGVLWVVLKQPMGFAPEQINLFSRLYPMNARPVQAAGDRMIKESN